jgi:hypothetical protein
MSGENNQSQQQEQETSLPQPASVPAPQPSANETPYVRPEPTLMPGDLDTVRKGGFGQ